MERRNWDEHLAAAQREGKNVRQYATEHGLSVHAMYSARRKLRGRDGVAAGKVPTPVPGLGNRGENPFVGVRLGPSPAPLRAQLANGVMLELAIGASDSAALTAAINVLARLPCSA
jgi:hypothetical protein